MKSESFIAVYDWMLEDLPLNCREAMLFAVIYSFSERGGGFSGGQAYLARRLKIARQTVNETLRKLTKEKLVLKQDISRCGVRYCVYTVNRAALAAKVGARLPEPAPPAPEQIREEWRTNGLIV